MPEQQQQQAGGQVQTAGPARIGLARSRHALGNDDETSSKKHKGPAPSFARDSIKVDNGKHRCTHCNSSVSSNITRAKLHLLSCPKFLESESAQAAADSNEEVSKAIQSTTAEGESQQQMQQQQQQQQMFLLTLQISLQACQAGDTH